MAEKMSTIGIEALLNWIFSEYQSEDSIFGIPSVDFLSIRKNLSFKIFGDLIDTPIGPAAGPHTQLSQNIIASYLSGGRFFELKTVQIKDDLQIDKPCIDAQDECYNTEWSQELLLEESFDEYLKAWFILHILNEIFYPAVSVERGFIFNMSVGYNLEGIKSERMQKFIDSLIDASKHLLFNDCKDRLLKYFQNGRFLSSLKNIAEDGEDLSTRLKTGIENISPRICNSVTLSTMHGCPPDEIEAIGKYLLNEKNLHTYIKLNPTLLGYETVNEILQTLGYKKIFLSKDSFENDLKIDDAVAMISRLQKAGVDVNREFGVKLSNTLPVKNKKKVLSGDEMYMSGRSLFPLTINTASKLAEAFNADINISYSGGAAVYNTMDILKCGIFPVTYATDLLKPGGYRRLTQIAKKLESEFDTIFRKGKINLEILKRLADDSLKDSYYKKETRQIDSIKVPTKLDTFDCFTAPCVIACPIHQDVPEYIKLVEEGRFEEAFDVVTAKNALPNITAHICDHQCQFHCTRVDYDEPVMIRDLKKAAVENAKKKLLVKETAESNNIKCAVVGAGPSGLSASYFLARAGFEVTVFEKHDKAGGVVQNIIPEFRLPQSAINNDIEFIKKHGVNFIFNADPKFSIKKLKHKGFKYIYLGIGAEKSNELKLNGSGKNIIDALDFLGKYHHHENIKLGKTVAVIGGGNSAMDAARAAKRIDGVEKVYIIYRRTKEFMPADREEFDNAIEDGVEFRELLMPIEFDDQKLQCQKIKLGEIGKDGRREVIPVNDQFEDIKIDFIISAIGETVDIDILKKNKISINKLGKIETNKLTNETQLENVFIGGDSLRGPSTVVESIADGKKAAEAIIKKENLEISFNKNLGNLFDIEQRKKRIIAQKGNVIFQNRAPNPESSRCLECNIICNKCVDVCPNRANISISINENDFRDINQIIHIDWMCNECGNCETFCPHQGAPYKDKITLFKNEHDFNNSRNDGFYVLRVNGRIEIGSRFNSKFDSLQFTPAGELLGKDKDKDKDEEWIRYNKMIGKIISDYPHVLLKY